MKAEIALVNGQLCAGVPIESRSWAVSIVGIVCVPVALTCVALRCYSRYSMLRRLGYDDWIVVTAAVFLIDILALDLQSVLSLCLCHHDTKDVQMPLTMDLDGTIGISILTELDSF